MDFYMYRSIKLRLEFHIFWMTCILFIFTLVSYIDG